MSAWPVTDGARRAAPRLQAVYLKSESEYKAYFPAGLDLGPLTDRLNPRKPPALTERPTPSEMGPWAGYFPDLYYPGFRAAPEGSAAVQLVSRWGGPGPACGGAQLPWTHEHGAGGSRLPRLPCLCAPAPMRPRAGWGARSTATASRL